MNRWPARAISNILWGKTRLLKLSVTISLQPLDGFFNLLGNIMLGGPKKAHRLLCVAQRVPSFARSPCCPSSFISSAVRRVREIGSRRIFVLELILLLFWVDMEATYGKMMGFNFSDPSTPPLR